MEEGRPKSKVGCSLLSMSSFLQEAKEAQELYALVTTLSINKTNVPAEVEHLLQEFKDPFLEELPLELPPLRDIQHHIDLIPRASLPNKSAYRMSLKDHEEMRR